MPVFAGSLAFAGAVLNGPVGVTVAGTDTATATGLDFRSGAVTLPAGSPRVEVVLGRCSEPRPRPDLDRGIGCFGGKTIRHAKRLTTESEELLCWDVPTDLP